MTNTVQDNKQNKARSKMGRARALAKLGLVAAALYAAPALTQMNAAQAASGGGGFFGGGMGGGSGAISFAQDQTAIKECGACHDPYSPRYLPDGSWAQMMNNLQNHFGEDASLDQQTTQQLLTYYTRNAGGRGTGALRITETRWFRGGHGGEARFSQNRQPHECSKCHGGAPGQNNNRGGGSWWGN